jgi:hypothetical protein
MTFLLFVQVALHPGSSVSDFAAMILHTCPVTGTPFTVGHAASVAKRVDSVVAAASACAFVWKGAGAGPTCDLYNVCKAVKVFALTKLKIPVMDTSAPHVRVTLAVGGVTALKATGTNVYSDTHGNDLFP